MKNNKTKREKMMACGKKILWAITWKGQYIIPESASSLLLDTIEFLHDKKVIEFKEHEDDVLIFSN